MQAGRQVVKDVFLPAFCLWLSLKAACQQQTCGFVNTYSQRSNFLRLRKLRVPHQTHRPGKRCKGMAHNGFGCTRDLNSALVEHSSMLALELVVLQQTHTKRGWQVARCHVLHEYVLVGMKPDSRHVAVGNLVHHLSDAVGIAPRPCGHGQNAEGSLVPVIWDNVAKSCRERGHLSKWPRRLESLPH